MSDSKDVQAVETQAAADDGTPKILATSSLAARFEEEQHALSKKDALMQNKWSLLWCTYMFFLCITWGFDGMAGAIVISLSEFRKDFGYPYGGDYVVGADWQLGFSAATTLAMVTGALLGGLGINRWGRQPVLLVAFIISIAGVFLQFFSSNVQEFLGGKLLTGLPLGVFTTAAPPYASEMAPLAIRGSVAAAMNFSIVLGQLIGYGVMRETSSFTDARQYKILFATQWGFAAVALIFLPFFPESPYWLVAHGRADKARANLVKLHDDKYDVDGHMAEIEHSLAKQTQDDEAAGSFAECFSKQAWKRTLVACSMFFIQNASGAVWVIGYMGYYFQLVGMDAATTFDTTVGLCGLMVVGNMAGWFLVDYLGRRTAMFWGSAILTCTLLLIGVLSLVDSQGALWSQVVFMAIWSFVYQATLGAVAWPIAAEAPTSRLRAPTQALATMTNGFSSAIWAMSLPYALNPDQGNLGGKIAFIFTAVLGLSTIFIFFAVPETKNRSYIEIDELWKQGIPPRKFKETNLVTITDDDAVGEKSGAKVEHLS